MNVKKKCIFKEWNCIFVSIYLSTKWNDTRNFKPSSLSYSYNNAPTKQQNTRFKSLFAWLFLKCQHRSTPIEVLEWKLYEKRQQSPYQKQHCDHSSSYFCLTNTWPHAPGILSHNHVIQLQRIDLTSKHEWGFFTLAISSLKVKARHINERTLIRAVKPRFYRKTRLICS
jgi:hypothetical protein